MKLGSIIPEEFGEVFRSGRFEDIYRITSDDFQQMVSLSDFIDLSMSFNEGVRYYELAFKTVLLDVDTYVWIDDHKEKAINVMFDKDH